MNCDECKERVFELIEEEATHPQSVRKVLDACPECRALFEQMKAGLDLASELPIEEPPHRLDAAILEAATRRQRSEGSRRPSRRWERATPWAMAAVALLAIGIGLWAVPRDVQLEDEPPPGDLPQSVEPVAQPASEAALETAPEADVQRSADRALAEHRQATVEPARRRPSAGSVAESPAARKRRPSTMREKREPPRPSARPPSGPIEDEHEGTPAMTLRAYETAAGNAVDRAGREASEQRICDRLIREHDLNEEANVEIELDSEQQLKLGRCYAKAGRVDTARTLLKRAANDVRTKNRAEAELRLLDRKRD